MVEWFAISLAVVTALIGTVVIAFGRRLARGGSAVVRVTVWIAVIWGFSGAIGAVVVALSTLFQDDVRITVPVEEYWPRLPDLPQLPDSDLSTWLPRPRFDLTLPFWPIAAGLAFAALATIFRYGARLQRDTEGLV